MPTALITGITGQDGSYLAELLLSKGYAVHGVVRRVALEDPSHRLWRLRHILGRITLHNASLESYASLVRVVAAVNPDELYHLAAQSFVSYSFEDEFSTLNTNINGTHYLLSAIHEIAPQCRFYFAGSSEMFGLAELSPENEEPPFHPRSPYGISKVAGVHLARNYREAYGLKVSSGILYNHELEELVRRLRSWSECGHDVETQAAWLHHEAAQIHPFENGNGRWARLLANIWLKRHGLPIVAWPDEPPGATSTVRDEHLAAMKAADHGDYAALIGLHRRLSVTG